MSKIPSPSETSVAGPTHAWAWKWDWVIVWLSFALFACIRSPLPAVNEPHFLSKAKHFWAPEWCARDPFLQSANAHYVFYATFGLITQVLTLEQAAWTGRVIGWGLVASGWCAIARQLSPRSEFGIWSAWLFLGLASIGNWSGEWVIGGIEAKVISYGCAWWSLAKLLQGRRVLGGALSGLSVSFHPVVGIWHTGAAVLALCGTFKRGVLWSQLAELLRAGLFWILLAAPGLVPALAMIREGAPDQAYAADYIQVFHRLNHHLDPFKFQIFSYYYYGLMIFLLVAFRATTRPHESLKLLYRYVFVAITIAFAGFLLRSLPRISTWVLDHNLLPAFQDSLKWMSSRENHLAKWLKFYPFRLADVAIPLVLTMQLVLILASRMTVSSFTTEKSAEAPLLSRVKPYTGWGLSGCIFLASIVSPFFTSQKDSRLHAELFPDWRDVCAWIRRETPADALCYVPSQGFGLKWYAERAEYVSHKDCPQDAAGIVAWNNRLRLIDRWSTQFSTAGYSRATVQELRKKTGIDFVITPTLRSKLAAFPMPPIFQNQSYQVYRLSDLD